MRARRACNRLNVRLTGVCRATWLHCCVRWRHRVGDSLSDLHEAMPHLLLELSLCAAHAGWHWLPQAFHKHFSFTGLAPPVCCPPCPWLLLLLALHACMCAPGSGVPADLLFQQCETACVKASKTGTWRAVPTCVHPLTPVVGVHSSGSLGIALPSVLSLSAFWAALHRAVLASLSCLHPCCLVCGVVGAVPGLRPRWCAQCGGLASLLSVCPA
jgi:hypothetical protein